MFNMQIGGHMKVFTATDARNQFGAFLDAGMVEGVKVVRNNRVLGYFLPEREYEALRAGGRAAPAGLRPDQEETLVLYSAGKISGSEAKADLHGDRRELLALLAARNLPLPRLAAAAADAMARETLTFVEAAAKPRTRVRKVSV